MTYDTRCLGLNDASNWLGQQNKTANYVTVYYCEERRETGMGYMEGT